MVNEAGSERPSSACDDMFTLFCLMEFVVKKNEMYENHFLVRLIIGHS